MRLARATGSAHGTDLSIFFGNSSRFVRRLSDLCSVSANDSDASIIAYRPNCPRPAVAKGVVARLALNCKHPLPNFNLSLIQCIRKP